ncbi:response regulator [Methanolobus sp. ZRKC3]|uniref:response regulator n=1 Tax=Methanolobus sp. ZRKC3 TaxID=3125786 RepID=UPI00324E504E
MTKILVVEDNPMNMELVNYLLTTNGVDVTQAFNGQDALERVQNTNLDLILMDIQLPGIDGLEVLKMIREDLKQTEVPVVALTAHAMKGDEKHFIEAGCIGYISKPIDVSTFMDEVNYFLAK